MRQRNIPMILASFKRYTAVAGAYHRGFRQRLARVALALSAFTTLVVYPQSGAAQGQSAPGIPPGGVADRGALAAFTDEFFERRIADQQSPGAVVAIVQDGRIVLTKHYGVATQAPRRPIDINTTRFRIASISKLFTATAVMQLVEQGKLDLNANINTYLQLFQIPETYPQPITLAHLLTHTAGFDQTQVGSATTDPAARISLGAYLAAHMPARVRPPGAILSYSNYGYALAGYIVEQAVGMPFEQYVKAYILRPLAMEHTSFTLTPDLATGYARGEAVRSLYLNDSPGGALISTAPDMASFMLAHLQDGRYETARILQPASVQQMLRQQFTHHPKLVGIGYGFFESNQNGKRALWHNGGLPGYRSMLYLLPDESIGLFVANNSDADLGEEFVDAFLDHFYPAPATTPDTASYPPERFDHLAGTYMSTRYSRDTSLRVMALGNQISVIANDDGTITINNQRFQQIEPLVFQQIDGGRIVAFREDEQGRIAYMFRGSVAFERAPWFRTLPVALGSLAFFLLVFGVTTSIVWRAWFGKRNRSNTAAPATGIAQLTPFLAYLLSIVGLVLFIGFSVTIAVDMAITYGGAFPMTTFVLYLAWPLVILTGGLIVAVVAEWLQRAHPVVWRIYFSGVALTAAGFCAWLSEWNLLGPHW